MRRGGNRIRGHTLACDLPEGTPWLLTWTIEDSVDGMGDSSSSYFLAVWVEQDDDPDGRS